MQSPPQEQVEVWFTIRYTNIFNKQKKKAEIEFRCFLIG